MDKEPNQMFDGDIALEGPDYVALVIEWDGIADELEQEITSRNATELPRGESTKIGSIVKVLGVVGLLAFVGWGLHRLRA